MGKQIVNWMNEVLLTEVSMHQYAILIVCHFQIFLHQSLLSCPFDRLYALKPKNPE
ncbi:hypothetical protein [Pedobacter terrae]|uniref:hypothetical protein n=1 Tax=Pedobacter terrae TaxID=405671 RepID=UPI001ABFDCED|nr:hypothetical protein [Pedobacter terrae]